MRISKGYWIWAQFDNSCTQRLLKIKNELENLIKGPVFDIHLTLSGPLKGLDQNSKKKLFMLAALVFMGTLRKYQLQKILIGNQSILMA